MDNIGCVKKKIEEIIKKSPVLEDPIHSKNTLEWLLKLNPDADEAQKIAALGPVSYTHLTLPTTPYV